MTEQELSVFGWMDKTRPNKVTASHKEKQELTAMRERVFSKVGTTAKLMAQYKHLGTLSEKLYTAFQAATQEEKEGYRVNVDFEVWAAAKPAKIDKNKAAKMIKALDKVRSGAAEAIAILSSR